MISADDVRGWLTEFHRIATDAAFDPTSSKRANATQQLPVELHHLRALAQKSYHCTWCAELIDRLERAESIALSLANDLELKALAPRVVPPESIRQNLDLFREGIETFPVSNLRESEFRQDWIVPRLVALEEKLRFLADWMDEFLKAGKPQYGTAEHQTWGHRQHEFIVLAGNAFFDAVQRGAFTQDTKFREVSPTENEYLDVDAAFGGHEKRGEVWAHRLMQFWIYDGKYPRGWTYPKGFRMLADAVHKERLRLMPTAKPFWLTVEWLQLPDLTAERCFAGIEELSRRLIDGFEDALKRYRLASESIARFSLNGCPQIIHINHEDASRDLRQYEDWLRELAGHVMVHLPDLAKTLRHVTRAVKFLDTEKKLAPVLNELRTIEVEAHGQRVKAESETTEPVVVPTTAEKTKTTPMLPAEVCKRVREFAVEQMRKSQKAIVVILCDRNEPIPIVDLANEPDINWVELHEAPYKQPWDSAKKEIDKKLQPKFGLKLSSDGGKAAFVKASKSAVKQQTSRRRTTAKVKSKAKRSKAK